MLDTVVQLATQVVHTSGVNWASVSAIVVAVCAVLGIFGSLFAYFFGRWTRALGDRLDSQDTKIDANTAITTATAMSSAKLEGYLAGRAGVMYPASAVPQ